MQKERKTRRPKHQEILHFELSEFYIDGMENVIKDKTHQMYWGLFSSLIVFPFILKDSYLKLFIIHLIRTGCTNV